MKLTQSNQPLWFIKAMLVNFVLQSFEKITMTAVGSACNAYKSRRVDIRITVKTESKTA